MRQRAAQAPGVNGKREERARGRPWVISRRRVTSPSVVVV